MLDDRNQSNIRVDNFTTGKIFEEVSLFGALNPDDDRNSDFLTQEAVSKKSPSKKILDV